MTIEQQKEDYQDKMEAKLKEWSAKIEVMKAKAENVKADAKIKYHEQIEDMRSKEKAARASLTELKEAGAEASRHLKENAEEAIRQLREEIKTS